MLKSKCFLSRKMHLNMSLVKCKPCLLWIKMAYILCWKILWGVKIFHDFLGTIQHDVGYFFQELVEVNQCLLAALGVSHPSIETIVQVTKKHGLATKLTGAGGGGCTYTILPSGENWDLTLCGLVTPYGDRDLCQHFFFISVTTLSQVMACCLMAPSHYLKQSWLIIN